ncbi:hypothetical protein OGAPHI_000556 [Ogataea philodendri]|uniref:NAD-dependent epimerase/dehydratase domain-containing protein n=1 Tax=Ogataea philodendri TaxID=1378263 RepID=A0A9P8PFJ1_9ASCO|nr:uncharacterized protein OGAPHI_000556 [Ogataea philodendri]KAH3671333.1 hypothetical protein OGAPHI_000556 [Ogataea philodendri]
MTSDSFVPEGSTVLVTGGTGFIGAHCIQILLEQGFNVKAAARSQEKADQMAQVFDKYKNQLSFGIIEDITDYNSLVNLVKGCTAILHLASPYTYAVNDFKKELLDPALKGTLTILEAANQEKSIKRIVITSSFAAVFDATKGLQPGVALTERDFSPLTYEDGIKTSDPAVAYRASKIVSERAAWDFVKDKRPAFDIVVLCPPMVYGPLVSTKTLKSLDQLNFSNSTIWNMATSGSNSSVPPTKGPVFVDVRDLAYAHYQSLVVPEASNQRFMVSAGVFSNQEICDALREQLSPARAKKVPVGTPNKILDPEHFTTDSTKAIEVLGMSFRPVNEPVVDLVNQLYDFLG